MFGLIEDVFEVGASLAVGGVAGKVTKEATGSDLLGLAAGLATAGLTHGLLDDD